jgi:hypothetical protein
VGKGARRSCCLESCCLKVFACIQKWHFINCGRCRCKTISIVELGGMTASFAIALVSLPWVWYSSSSSLRLYNCWSINSLNSNNTSMGLRPTLLLCSALDSGSRMLQNISHGIIRLISLNQSLGDSSSA